MCYGSDLRAYEVPGPVLPPLLLRPTIYYKPIVNADPCRCESSERVEMLSPDNKRLVAMCLVDFKNCVMQGACYVFDEEGRFRSFNYYARGADGVPRFTESNLTKCPYGYGMRNVCLDPYFTVAADLNFYKLGDVIFVPQFVGEVMPDGETHDGFFVVRDAGGAILGPWRFDFYTGFTKPFIRSNPFYRLGFANVANGFEFRLATEEETRLARERTRYPGVRKAIFIPPKR